MRLLNCHTLRFQEFLGNEIPRYLILSHRWGADEVDYKDFRKGRGQGTDGYRKILEFCRFARTRLPPGLHEGAVGRPCDWVWIDTCCIDKRSSAELSEAINSMYAWYQRAQECIVYMADVPSFDAGFQAGHAAFCASSWFARGWTLQELVAPHDVLFCNKTWGIVGHKCIQGSCKHDLMRFGLTVTDCVAGLTGIHPFVLKNPNLVRQLTIAERMSWAARRTTTRIEDQAYCLFGLLGVNLPLLYGEGQRAFRRLQEELLRRTTDHSLLTSGSWSGPYLRGLLVDSPSWYQTCGNTIHFAGDTPMSIVEQNRGFELQCTPFLTLELVRFGTLHVILLNCHTRPTELHSNTPIFDHISCSPDCVKCAEIRSIHYQRDVLILQKQPPPRDLYSKDVYLRWNPQTLQDPKKFTIKSSSHNHTEMTFLVPRDDPLPLIAFPE